MQQSLPIFKISATILAVFALLCPAKTQAQLPFETDGFGVSAEAGIDLKRTEKLIGATSYYESFFALATAFYNWHPLKNRAAAAQRFFVRPALGGGYYKYNSDVKRFVMDAQVQLGYTLVFDKVGVDFFTGPKAQFGLRKYSTNMTHARETNHIGGVAWTIGAGVNFQHFGVWASYNAPLSDIARYKITDQGKITVANFGVPMAKMVSVGLSYYF